MTGSALDTLVRKLKLAAMLLGLTSLILVTALVISAAGPADKTYSQDHFTVANTTDGEQVIVTYEVTTTLSENADTEERHNRMRTMDAAASCANGNLDAYIETHTEAQVQGADLREIVVGCQLDDVSVERLTVADRHL